MRTAQRCLLSLLLCFGISASAANGLSPGTSPAKEAKIRELMKLTGSAELGVQVMNQLITSFRTAMPDAPEQFWKDFAKEAKPSDFVDRVIPIYSRHFSEQDLDGLIAFYRTPLGQKVIHEMPATMTECMAAGQEWGRQLSAQMIAKAKANGYKTKR
jgi:hypothetical protein